LGLKLKFPILWVEQLIKSIIIDYKDILSIDKLYRKINEGEVGQGSNNQTKINRILIVDDEPDVCTLYQMVLEDAGYRCISYSNSVKAMHEFIPNYYDLILLDIKMPVIDGFELCEKIREANKSIVIIFITASEHLYKKVIEEGYPELINYNSIRYVQKPIANEELTKNSRFDDLCRPYKLNQSQTKQDGDIQLCSLRNKLEIILIFHKISFICSSA
jgi:CheY-like chemotaxis protein